MRLPLCQADPNTKWQRTRDDERTRHDGRLYVVTSPVHTVRVPHTHLVRLVLVGRDDARIPRDVHVCRRRPPRREVLPERLHPPNLVVHPDIARGRERAVKGVLGVDVLVERGQVRLDPCGR